MEKQEAYLKSEKNQNFQQFKLGDREKNELCGLALTKISRSTHLYISVQITKDAKGDHCHRMEAFSWTHTKAALILEKSYKMTHTLRSFDKVLN